MGLFKFLYQWGGGMMMITAFLIGITDAFTVTKEFVSWASPWGIEPIHFAFGLLGIGAIYTTIVQGLRIRRFQLSSPLIEFDGISPATTPLYSNADGVMQNVGQGYFVRLAFKNNTKNPSGIGSTSQETTAHISIFDNDRNMLDDWEGRWANLNEPRQYNEIWALNRYDIQANNQQAILDIGLRLLGQSEFQGWDNYHYLHIGQPRRHINPGSYKVKVKIAASNAKHRDFWFSLDIPNQPQTGDFKHVGINPIRKPRNYR